MRKPAAAFRLFRVAASTALREKAAYAGNFAGSMFTYALFVFIFSRVWASAFRSAGTIAGYTLDMAIWYFIVAEIPTFGFGRFFATLSRDVKTGQIAYTLARPYDYLRYTLAERVGGSLVEVGIIMVEGLVLGLILAGPLPLPSVTAGIAIDPGAVPDLVPMSGLAGTVIRALAVVASLILSGVINYYLQAALALTALWLEENEAFFWIFQKLALVVGTLMPLEFLPDAVIQIARWTPFPYLAYAPARLAVAYSGSQALTLLGAQVLWVVVAAALARIVFVFGTGRLSVNGG